MGVFSITENLVQALVQMILLDTDDLNGFFRYTNLPSLRFIGYRTRSENDIGHTITRSGKNSFPVLF